MYDQIEKHYIVQFSDSMHIAAQQMQSRLRPLVQIRKLDADKFFYDGYGRAARARELKSRLNPTQFTDVERTRRMMEKRSFEVTIPIDRMDVENVLRDPQGDLAKLVMAEMERTFDRVVYDAMFADVKTGRDGETIITAATDGVRTVDATGGLVYEELLAIRQNFMDDDVGNEGATRFVMGISGDEHTSLMQEIELTSGDFSRQYVVDGGSITRAVGIDMITFAANAPDPILKVNSGTRDCFVMASGALMVGMTREFTITLKDRPDYVEVKQLQVTGVLGAVRTEGKLIQKVQTTD